uniref:4-coumarate--CoA ligase n=1 Tax=Kalanchoe fedtschenkoi TaxID=63787 RepID=A0A7N0T0N3_KALFE
MASFSQSHICQCLSRLAVLRRDSTLTICGNRQRTGRQFVEEVLSLARGLAELGLQRGEVVAISALNSDCYLQWLLAVTYVGGIVAPLNYRWSLEEYKYALAAVSPVMVVVDETFDGYLTDLQLSAIPSIRWHAFIGSQPADMKEIKSEEFRTQEVSSSFDYTWAPEGAAIICFTSGTSGRPKGVVISHDALIIQSLAKIAIVGYGEYDIYLHTASLCHIGGISSALAMLMAGACHIITPKFEAEKALKYIDDYQVTSFITVPAIMSDLISMIRVKKVINERRSVKKILNGGGSLQGKLIKDATKFFPMAKLQSAYGMTEGCSSLTFMTLYDPVGDISNQLHESLSGVDTSSSSQFGGSCVGKPAPHVELKIHTENTSTSSHMGKILTRGPHLMLRYWDNNSSGISTNQSKQIWHDTGDIGYLDGHGNLWLIGRTSGKIKSGGENVYPEEVEAVLLQHPAICSAVVIGVPNVRLGEMVVACVQLREKWLWDDKNTINSCDQTQELLLGQKRLWQHCRDEKLTGLVK